MRLYDASRQTLTAVVGETYAEAHYNEPVWKIYEWFPIDLCEVNEDSSFRVKSTVLRWTPIICDSCLQSDQLNLHTIFIGLYRETPLPKSSAGTHRLVIADSCKNPTKMSPPITLIVEHNFECD